MILGYQYPSIEWAEKAIEHARASLPVGAYNKYGKGKTSKVSGGGQQGGELRQEWIKKNFDQRGIVWGNCGDLARAAYEFLKVKKVYPVEQIHLGRGRENVDEAGDHVFVAMNRDKDWGKSNTTDEVVENWKGVIICDPWANIACLASDYPDRFAEKMRKWERENKEIRIGSDYITGRETKGPSYAKEGTFTATSWENAIRDYFAEKSGSSLAYYRQDAQDHYNVYLFNDFATFESYKDGRRRRHIKPKQLPSSISAGENGLCSKIRPHHLQRPAPSCLCFSFAASGTDKNWNIPDDGHHSSHGYLRVIKQMNHVLNAGINEDYTLYLSQGQFLDRVSRYARANFHRVI